MAHNIHTIHAIFNERWLMPVNRVEHYQYLINNLFSSNIAFERRAEESVYGIFNDTGEEPETEGRIGVVNIHGVLTKYDPECDYGMRSYGRFIKRLEARSDISAIVLDIDSPGGELNGVEELGNIIKNCSKPVVAFISDMAYSGGYWLACNAREIIANNTTAGVGSIGVMCSFRDYSEWCKKQGIKLVELYAPESDKKNEHWREYLKGNTKPIEESMSAPAQKFQNIVRANRPNVTEEMLSGKDYHAEDVVGTLIDSIGDIDFAIARAAELGKEARRGDKQAQTKIEYNMSKNKFENLAKAASVEEFAMVDGHISLNAEHATAIESKLAEADSLAEGKRVAEEALATEQSKVASHQVKITSLEARITELESAAGAPHSSVAPGADGGNNDEPTSAKTFAEAVAEAQKFKNE